MRGRDVYVRNSDLIAVAMHGMMNGQSLYSMKALEKGDSSRVAKDSGYERILISLIYLIGQENRAPDGVKIHRYTKDPPRTLTVLLEIENF